MAKKNVKSEGKTVDELFTKNVGYSMPSFQRGYVWDEDELEEYWEDLESLIKSEDNPNETSFLGALVLQEDDAEGKSSKGLERYIVIDGQQRLTTFYLTLLALLVYAIERGKKLYEQEEDSRMDRPDFSSWSRRAASDDHKIYLFSREVNSEGDVRLNPSLSDNAQFNVILSELKAGLKGLGKLTGEKERVLPKLLNDEAGGKKSGNLLRAYRILEGKIKTFIENDGGSEEKQREKNKQRDIYDKIFDVLVNRTEVVQIITGPNLSPYEIFDRLNTSGVPLDTLDLVRNYTLGKTSSGKANADKSEKFAAGVWRPFEKELQDVEKITYPKPLTGKAKEKKEKKQSEDFFIVYGTIEVDNFTTRKKIIRLKKHWDEKIDKEQRRDEAPKIVVDSLRGHLPHYLALCAEQEPAGIDSKLWELIQGMKELPIPPLTYPFLMPVIRSSMQKRGLPVVSAIQAFKIVESFLVRLALAGSDTRRMSSLFINVWTELGEEKMNPELLWEKIKEKKRDVAFLGNDDEIKKRILNESIDSKKDKVKYILLQYETHLRNRDSAAPLTLNGDYHIDHILPQAKGKVKGRTGSEDEERAKRARLCGTLGNLTLLDKGINLRKSARGLEKEDRARTPEEKENNKRRSVRELLQGSSLTSVGELLKDFDKGGDDSWEKDSIEKRGEELGKWAIERWPLG